MAASAYYTQVQNMYVAYFGRPADKLGLEYYAKLLDANGGNDKAMLHDFANSTESKGLYNQTALSAKINAMYNILFGRDGDLEGITHWASEVQLGRVILSEVAAAIAFNAQPADKAIYESKLTAAAAFTAKIDSAAELTAYETDPSAGRTWLASVKDAATATAAQATIDSTLTAIVTGVDSTAGKTFTLTTGVDALVGTNGNDTFIAATSGSGFLANATLNTPDSIDGGAGVDTLKIYADAVTNTQQGTVTAIENILIDNSQGTVFADANGDVNAAKFVGATSIWQIGDATDVVGLASTTTAGFRNTADVGLSVAAAATATAATIALDNVKGAPLSNVETLDVSGAALNAVAITGTIAKADSTLDDAATLDVTVTAGKDVQTVSFATSVNTILAVDNALTSTKDVTTVNAEHSTGNIDFDGAAATVQNIKTGSGDDKVTLSFVTVGATATAAAKNSSVATGAGDDVITVSNTGTATATVSAGAGDDTIDATKKTGGKLVINGGDGNDVVDIAGDALETTDVIDGGEGVDAVSQAGSLTARTVDQFIVLNKVLTNFETLTLTSAEGTDKASGLDLSKLSTSYKTVEFAAASFATKVDGQALIANDDLDVWAKGYVAGDNTATPATTTTYGGALTVTAEGNAAINAFGDSIALTVKAASDLAAGVGDVSASLTGDVKTATVTLVNGVDEDDAFSVADFALDTATTATNGAFTALGGLTSLTLKGNGTAVITNAASAKLVTIDASGLDSVDAEGNAAAGLDYTSDNTSAETIKLGNGIDIVTLNASTYGATNAYKFDTVSGLNIVLDTAGTALDATSDELVVGALSTFKKVTTTQTDLDLALKDLAALADNNLVFKLGSDTYVYADVGTSAGLVDATDVVVKLTGTIDLDALVIALG